MTQILKSPNIPQFIWDALKEAEDYGASLACVCADHKDDKKAWVCSRHGMHFPTPVQIEFKDGSSVTLPKSE